MLLDHAELLAHLASLDEAALDALPLGIIGFDAQGLVQRYNRCEQEAADLRPSDVLGRHVFSEVAQCMNNFMVAQRFEDAAAAGVPLDAVLDYQLTWRMRPTPIRLRLLWAPGQPLRYLVLQRLA